MCAGVSRVRKMAKVTYIVLVVAVVLIAYLWHLNSSPRPPVRAPPDDAWWGPGHPKQEDTAIRPFKIHFSDDDLRDLHARLDRTRPLTPPLEGINFQYGFNTDTLQKLLKYWRHDYKWRDREAYLNSYPHYKTRIQGLDIHFIHIKPKTSAAIKRSVPLLLLHGWPGSVREFYSLFPFLTQQPQHGADFVFEVIAPSLPGYGFSDGAAKVGLGAGQMAVVFKLLMQRLGFQSFYVHGGDWGSVVASNLGLFYPKMVRGLHMTMCTATLMNVWKIVLGSLYPPLVVDKEHEHQLYPLRTKVQWYLLESGYFHIQATKPDTVGVGLTDSPAGLAAYILEKFSTATNYTFTTAVDGGLHDVYTHEDLLDNVMIYWITGSITTSMRLYAENFIKQNRDLQLESAPVPVSTWCSKFEKEIFWNPDWMLRLRYPQLVRSHSHDFGGHFAALQVPKAFAEDVWASFVEAENIRQSKKEL